METTKLPPIPTPASQRWREFRIQVLPFVMFLAIIVAIVVLWKNYVQPIGVIGFAETNQVNVTSLTDGIIQALMVESFQVVTQGQPIAVVSGADSELIKAQTDSAKADLMVMADRMKSDNLRNNQNLHDANQRLQSFVIDQAADRNEWVLKSNEFWRAKSEFATKVISEADFDRAKTGFEIVTTKITEREKAISSQLDSLDIMRKAAMDDHSSKSIDAALDAKSAEAEQMLKASTLRAPIDGMVSFVHHRKGERIIRGSSVATIVDPTARRVIGYVRQPVTLLPTTNDSVTIIKRTAPSAVAKGKIERIGAQFEFINPALLSSDTKRMEVGLPILVSVPPGFPLVPGEYVTLTIDYAR
jgi:multidrug resistance efflux pump